MNHFGTLLNQDEPAVVSAERSHSPPMKVPQAVFQLAVLSWFDALRCRYCRNQQSADLDT